MEIICNDTSGCDINESRQTSLSPMSMQWEGRTALMQASEGGHLEVVKVLLRAKAGVDMQDEVCCKIKVVYTWDIERVF